MNITKKDKPKRYHCNNCDYHTHDKAQWSIHLTRSKHIKNANNSTKQCRLCEQKFTEEGYIRHLDENRNLLALWNNRNHHTGVGYNADSWQIGFKEYGGHIGELLPKCGINKAWKRPFSTFDETMSHILREFKKIYNSPQRPQRGKLPNPFYYLTHSQCAPYEEMTEEEEAEWMANDNILKDEVSKKKEGKSIESLEKLLDFKFSDIELEHGYYLDLNRDEDFKFSKKTYAFCDFIGLYQPNFNLKELLEIHKEYNNHIIFIANEENRRYGMFYIEDSSNGTYEEIAEWKQPVDNEDRELIWLIEEESASESESESESN
tara:strand:+ start:277 stop:1233 length:957 start_codon:yes stop_codon:yes gene_type:complete